MRQKHPAFFAAGPATRIFQPGEPGIADEDRLAASAAVKRRAHAKPLYVKSVDDCSGGVRQVNRLSQVRFAAQAVFDRHVAQRRGFRQSGDIADRERLRRPVPGEGRPAIAPEIREGQRGTVQQSDVQFVAIQVQPV